LIDCASAAIPHASALLSDREIYPIFRIRKGKDDTLLTAYKRSAVCGMEATYLQKSHSDDT